MVLNKEELIEKNIITIDIKKVLEWLKIDEETLLKHSKYLTEQIASVRTDSSG